MASQARYLEIVDEFEKVNAKEARDLLNQAKGDLIYIGRDTCGFCLFFIEALHVLATSYDIKIHYLFSQDLNDLEAINQLREDYEIETVPSLIYADHEGIHLKSDSRMTVMEILDFLKLELE